MRILGKKESLQFLLKALSDAGKTNVAYKVLLNEEKPGWLYEVLQDSSTVWEYLKVQIDDYIMGIC